MQRASAAEPAEVDTAAIMDPPPAVPAQEDVLSELPQLARSRALTKAESEDFANAEQPPSTPTAALRGSRALSSSLPDGSGRSAPVSATSGTGGGSVGPADFDLLCVIGQGAFGKVRTAPCAISHARSDRCIRTQVVQVRHKPSEEILAMKVAM